MDVCIYNIFEACIFPLFCDWPMTLHSSHSSRVVFAASGNRSNKSALAKWLLALNDLLERNKKKKETKIQSEITELSRTKESAKILKSLTTIWLAIMSKSQSFTRLVQPEFCVVAAIQFNIHALCCCFYFLIAIPFSFIPLLCLVDIFTPATCWNRL